MKSSNLTRYKTGDDQNAVADNSRFGASVLLRGPSLRIVLHRKLLIVCFAIPVVAGALASLLVPSRGTADALLLVSDVERVAADGTNRGWVPWDPTSFIAQELQPLRVFSTEDPGVVRIEATANTPQSAMTALSRVLALPRFTRHPPPDKQAETPGPSYETASLAEDVQQASRRVADLTQRLDTLQQQAAGAKAVSAAAGHALATEPATVQDSWQTEPNPPSDSERALLLSLMVEREHLVAQYAADFPATREINRKIALVQAAVASDERSRRLTIRAVRNPTAIALTERIALSHLTEEDAHAQARVVQGQLADARAHHADLVRATDGIHGASVAVPTPPEFVSPAPSISVLGMPTARTTGWIVATEILLFGLALGSGLVVLAAGLQRWTLHLLFPLHGIQLRGDSPLATMPHLADVFGSAPGPNAILPGNLAETMRR